jgi:hypothetical protein
MPIVHKRNRQVHQQHSRVGRSVIRASQAVSHGRPELHPENRFQGHSRAN